VAFVTTPIIGEIWESETLTRKFRVLSGPEAMTQLPGRGWRGEWFVGHRALMYEMDGVTLSELALVGLTKKPADYPYDWVLI
jgi:hypothetical protein